MISYLNASYDQLNSNKMYFASTEKMTTLIHRRVNVMKLTPTKCNIAWKNIFITSLKQLGIIQHPWGCYKNIWNRSLEQVLKLYFWKMYNTFEQIREKCLHIYHHELIATERAATKFMWNKKYMKTMPIHKNQYCNISDTNFSIYIPRSITPISTRRG